jgi:hypothetical protein
LFAGDGEMTRIQSIDILRGAVMIVMALDHIRDFLNSAAQSFSPEDLSRTTAGRQDRRNLSNFDSGSNSAPAWFAPGGAAPMQARLRPVPT